MRSHSVLQIGLGVALMAGAISVATAADMPSSDNIGVFRIEFPALQHGIEDPVPRHRVRPGRGVPLPITVGSKGRDASMKSNTLVGSWINVASGRFAVQG